MNCREFEDPEAPYDLLWDQMRLGRTYYQVEGLDDETLDATSWLVLLYLPIFPLERVRLKRDGQGWKRTNVISQNPASVLLVYLKAYVFAPVLLAIPVLPFTKEFFPLTGLPQSFQIPGIVIWLAGAIALMWKMLDKHEASLRSACSQHQKSSGA